MFQRALSPLPGSGGGRHIIEVCGIFPRTNGYYNYSIFSLDNIGQVNVTNSEYFSISGNSLIAKKTGTYLVFYAGDTSANDTYTEIEYTENQVIFSNFRDTGRGHLVMAVE